jgi:hypothetical protein
MKPRERSVYFSIFITIPSLGLRTRPESTENRIVMGFPRQALMIIKPAQASPS